MLDKTKIYGMLVWFYIKNMLLALDQFGNSLLTGDPDETISRRAGRAREDKQKWGCVLCDFLDKIDKRHCEKAVAHQRREEGYNSTIQMWKRWKADHGKTT